MLALPKLSLIVFATAPAAQVAALIEEASHALVHARALEFLILDSRRDARLAKALEGLLLETDQIKVLPGASDIDAALAQAARQARGDWLVTLDSSGRADPHDLPELLCAARHQGLALVQGRAHHASRARHWLARLAAPFTAVDAQPQGLYLIEREAMCALPPLKGLMRFLPLLIRRGGGRVGQHPIHWRTPGDVIAISAPRPSFATLGETLRQWRQARRWRPRQVSRRPA
ncbi:glycosyltransferase [Salinicola sp. DM10]|uniref:glycosyltransferase n=1 Tax=Salinicola sp. DM10 TaxID=2815721 RepID=UPI001A8C7030|nr:glycosyltransferase [Salinicola sp. DM10]MCE3026314.1 glycosyltransferase [Salinicola sp. DM10]